MCPCVVTVPVSVRALNFDQNMKYFCSNGESLLVLDKPYFSDFDEGWELLLQGFLGKMEVWKGTA